jgi:tight adherence protein B
VSPGLLLILTFGAGVLLVLGLASVVSDLFLKDRSAVNRRVDEEFRTKKREEIRKSLLFRDLGKLSDAPNDDEPTTFRQRLQFLIEQSGVAVTPERLIGIAAGGGLGVGALTGLVRDNVLTAVLFGLVAAAAPFLYVVRKRKKRLKKMLEQLPDVFDLMARVIRAGQTTEQAVQAVADEFAQPIGAEFAYCAEQQNLGLAPDLAFRDLARRCGLLEIKIFVLALVVQQQTGGNLAEIMDKLAGVVRERFRIAGKISALSAEGRMQVLVLLLLPFGIMGIMMLMSRPYADSLLNNLWLVGVMLVMEGIGAVWARKIVNFDY